MDIGLPTPRLDGEGGSVAIYQGSHGKSGKVMEKLRSWKVRKILKVMENYKFCPNVRLKI